MKYRDNKVTDIQIAYIGGGFRGWTWMLMTDPVLEEQVSGTIWLYDVDETVAGNNEVIGNRLMQREDTRGDWRFETRTSLQDALIGCDFVAISMLPGIFDEMESDVHLPERFGTYQSVGDTAGPGGMVRALRTIPMFVEIVEAAKACAPRTRVTNHTNPVSLCARTPYRIFPQIKAFGCCHEVFGTQKVLKDICEEYCGERGIDWHDIFVSVLGINHFTWLSSASYKGIDLFPVYRDYVSAHFEEGYQVEGENRMNSSSKCANRVKMDLFDRYGLIAAAGDRHLVEFTPGDEYLKDPEAAVLWKFGFTTVEWRGKDLQEWLDKGYKLAAGEEEVKLESTGEEGVLLIKALCGLIRAVGNVNIPNTACQITNFLASALVETNAALEKDHIYPLVAGEVPDPVKVLTMPHLKNHELIMEAALKPDREKVVQTLMSDPLAKRIGCNEEDVGNLMDEMIKNTRKYLPGDQN